MFRTAFSRQADFLFCDFLEDDVMSSYRYYFLSVFAVRRSISLSFATSANVEGKSGHVVNFSTAKRICFDKYTLLLINQLCSVNIFYSKEREFVQVIQNHNTFKGLL